MALIRQAIARCQPSLDPVAEVSPKVSESVPTLFAPTPKFDIVKPPAMSPALTGRLKVAGRDRVDEVSQLGARFLIPNDVTDMLSALEEETV